MATLYKDYNKDIKDLLTKNHCTPGEWKIENKAKATKGNYAIGTTSNARGEVSVDVEGLTVDGICYGKLTLTPKALNDVKATVRLENYQGHKVEGIVQKKGNSMNNVSFEVNHETLQPVLNGRVRVHDKVTDKAVDLGLSMAAADGVQVGCGASYNIKAQSCSWSLGCRAAATKTTTVALQTTTLKNLDAWVMTTAPIHPKFTPRVAVNVKYNVASKAVESSVGAEWSCQVIQGNTAKARIDQNMKWLLSYVAALRGGWTLVVSFDAQMKAGLTLTRN